MNKAWKILVSMKQLKSRMSSQAGSRDGRSWGEGGREKYRIMEFDLSSTGQMPLCTQTCMALRNCYRALRHEFFREQG